MKLVSPAASTAASPASNTRGRSGVAWPISRIEGVAAFAVGLIVWRLLDNFAFPSGMHGDYVKLDIFARVAFLLVNACALSFVCLLRAVRGGTAHVSRATYGVMAFPVLQTALSFVIDRFPASFDAWGFESIVNGACVFALFVSVLVHLVLSVGYAVNRHGTHAPYGSRIVLLFCFTWYAFILLLFQAIPYFGYPGVSAVCP